MSRLLLAAVLAAAVGPWACPARGEGPAADGPSAEILRARTIVLTAPGLAGRGSGTPEAEAAAETLGGWLEALGLEPAFAGSWFQEMPLSGTAWAGDDLAGKTGRNVAGILQGAGTLAGRYVVVGAHYDHLGRVEPGLEAAPVPARGEYYPGANDNASGVAVVLELARLAAAGDAPAGDRRSVLFALFAAEEAGLQGSGYMVGHLPVDAGAVDAMINIDTVGQLTGRRLYVSGVGTAAAFPAMVAAANTAGLDLALAQGGWSGSDHMSFNTREIPVLFIFGGAYPEYNRPADDWPTLDYAELAEVTSYTGRLLDLIRTEPGPMPWLMVAEKDLRRDEGEDQNRETWLGTLPDFTEEVVGYRLAGVFDGSPAAVAGLQKGDVLVRLGGDPVTDLVTFTRALRSHRPGDLVELRVERGGRTLNFTVVMGDRSDRR